MNDSNTYNYDDNNENNNHQMAEVAFLVLLTTFQIFHLRSYFEAAAFR